MRILHTADWHLGDRLGRIDRTDDLRRAVERVADYCKSESVDVLLVAGDLFSELARPDALRETIRHWQDVFRGFLEGGGTVLTLTGNHDNENFCQTLVHAMTLAAPSVGKPGDLIPPGRLYLAADPTFVKLQDKEHGHDVQFVLMPYPTPNRLLKGDAGQKYASPDEKNRLLTAAWSDALRELRAHPKYDPAAPSVLSAHVHMFGSQIGPSLFRLSEEEDVVVNGDDLAAQFDYVALGHIHKPQALAASHVRYSGSIEKMDLGEQADQQGDDRPQPGTRHPAAARRVHRREERPRELAHPLHRRGGRAGGRARRPRRHLPALVRPRLDGGGRPRPVADASRRWAGARLRRDGA